MKYVYMKIGLTLCLAANCNLRAPLPFPGRGNICQSYGYFWNTGRKTTNVTACLGPLAEIPYGSFLSYITSSQDGLGNTSSLSLSLWAPSHNHDNEFSTARHLQGRCRAGRRRWYSTQRLGRSHLSRTKLWGSRINSLLLLYRE